MKKNERKKWKALIKMFMLLITGCICVACSGDSDDDSSSLSLELNPASINFTKNANESQKLTITTSNDATWKIYDSECSDWLSLSSKEGKGSTTITLTTKNENKGVVKKNSLEVVATNEAGKVSKKITLTRDGYPDNLYARQTGIKLIMSYGMACAVEIGSGATYFKYKFFTADAFRNLDGNDDAIAQEATKSDWTRENIPSNGGGVEIVYNNCQPATDYVFVTVAYDREGNRGEINSYPFVTKDALEDNQPRVSIEPQQQIVTEVHDNNNGPWYTWDTSVDGGGTFYLTYACASDKIVETMQPHKEEFGKIDNKIGISIAWNIFKESQNDNLENAREVRFNKDNASGREKLFGKAFNNKTQWIEYRTTDKYLQIVTLAFKGNDFSNPSGLVSDVLYHVDNGVLREISNSDDSYLTVNKSNISFDYSGTSSSFSISSNVSWSVTSNTTWCTVSPSSGSYNGTVTVTASENTTTSDRQATITVQGGGVTRSISVTQGHKSSGDIPGENDNPLPNYSRKR